jgi:solute carrier family 25 uncoupling protein 8/9
MQEGAKWQKLVTCDWAAHAGDKTGQYSGMLDCFVKSFRSGGILTFYNGFLPNFARLGSWNCAMFLTVEQV